MISWTVLITPLLCWTVQLLEKIIIVQSLETRFQLRSHHLELIDAKVIANFISDIRNKSHMVSKIWFKGFFFNIRLKPVNLLHSKITI